MDSALHSLVKILHVVWLSTGGILRVKFLRNVTNVALPVAYGAIFFPDIYYISGGFEKPVHWTPNMKSDFSQYNVSIIMRRNNMKSLFFLYDR
jgi:hypothetical protein